MFTFQDLMIAVYLQDVDQVIHILKNTHLYNIDLGKHGSQLATELLCGRLTSEDTDRVLYQLKKMHSYVYFDYYIRDQLRNNK